jgi:hypothetical protein
LFLATCQESGGQVIIERGKERFRLQAEGIRKRIGSAIPKPHVIVDPDTLSDFSPSEWQTDDLS